MLNHKQVLTNKINNKRAKVAVIGLGYVGLPLAVEFAKRGFNVLGVDIDRGKIDKLKKGKSYIQDVPSEHIKEIIKNKRASFANDYKDVIKADAIIVSVPTPLRKTREPDISYVVNAAKEINRHFRKGQLIILESTTYPGTTEEILLPLFASKGWKVGKDFFLAFSPERVDPGNKYYNTSNITKVIGGVTRDCTFLSRLIYSKIIMEVVPVSNSRVAEMAKLLENTFRAVNVALINEIALMCDKLKINIWEVIEAAKTKPFGFMPFYPGPGLGGHCLPIDPLYLTWKSRLHGFEARLIELASQINFFMPKHVAKKVIELINDKLRKSIVNAKVLVIGVAYKKNVSDVRESPAIDVIRILIRRQVKVYYYDPFVPELALAEKKMHSARLTKKLVADSDCVVIVTDHDKVDYNFILKNARLIFDTRNVYKKNHNRKIHKI